MPVSTPAARTRGPAGKDHLVLPDCSALNLAVELSDEEKRELILAIAAGGVDAIDAWVQKRAQTDSSIARRVKALRDELLRRADELRRRLAGEFSANKEARMAAFEAERDALEAQRGKMRRDLELVRLEGVSSLERATFAIPLVHLALEAQNQPPPWWRKLWLAVVRALRTLLSWILAPFRLLAGKSGKPRGSRGRTAVLGHGGLVLDLSLARADPRFRKAVRDRLRTRPLKERMREAWNRLLAREDYEDLARRLMEESLASEERRIGEDVHRRESDMEARLSELSAEEEARRKALDDALARLDRERQEAEELARKAAEKEPFEAARRDVLSELEDAGLLKRGDAGWLVTERLVDRFAEIVLAEETRKMGAARGRATGAWADGEGNWAREPLFSEYDLSHMDILGSALRARSRTPAGSELRLYEDDVVIYREERGASHHVILIFDQSGSMEENGRIDAAKRAVLALHRAIKRDNATNRVDILAMSTSVTPMSLVEVWEAEPRGFTNTGNALKRAGDLLRASRTERGLVYLITDGLPEAYTKDGEDIASTPEKCLAYALEQARALKMQQTVELAIILLEADDAVYVKAAEAIAKETKGRVFKAKPEDLAQKLLRDFDRSILKAREIPARPRA
jgi:Mg-chelatase subunit ChlD